jgi:hypothetical protein
VPTILFDLLDAKFSSDAIFLLRRPMSRDPERFEQIMAEWMILNERIYGWVRPEGVGRAATYNRDISMVARCDLVLAFFMGTEMSGGTEHVVEKAIDQQIPVYSYGFVEEGMASIGSHDPANLWGAKLPF